MSKDNPTPDNAFSLSADFGHSVYIDADEYTVNGDGCHHYEAWRYVDTNDLCDDAPRRACPRCHLMETEDGHDPCIANLKGVAFACCGHGIPGGDSYVVFVDERPTLRDGDALKYFKSVGKDI